MNLFTTIAIHAYGTSEGVEKEWDERGRGQQQPDYMENCDGPNCGKNEVALKKGSAIPVPHLDNLELMMTSDAAGRNIHFDKEALKTVLRMALVQLDRDDVETRYLNSNSLSGDKTGPTTGHYVNVKFKEAGVKGR